MNTGICTVKIIHSEKNREKIIFIEHAEPPRGCFGAWGTPKNYFKNLKKIMGTITPISQPMMNMEVGFEKKVYF